MNYDPVRRRTDLMVAAQMMRCHHCGSPQIQLLWFNARASSWKCRMCRHAWEIEA